MLGSVPHRYLVPCVCFLLGAVFSVALYFVEKDQAKRLLVEQARGEAQVLGFLLSAELESSFRNNETGQARDAISHLAGLKHVQSVLLFDENDKVLFSLPYQFEDRGIAETPFFHQQPFVERIRRQFHGEIDLSDKGNICAFFPVQLNPGQDAVLPASTGVVVLSIDPREQILAAAQKAQRRSLTIGAFFLTLSLGLWLFFHRFVLVPLQSLSRATRKILSGSQEMIPVRGRDEVSSLARDFNEMSGQLAGMLSQLQGSEERLRLALQAANQGLYDLNVQSGQATVNEEYARMLGYEPATFEETNQKWLERLHPDDVERVGQVYRGYLSGTVPEYRVEFRQRTGDGRYIWILSLGRIVEWDESGRPLRMLGTHTDITDRVEAEYKLRHFSETLEQTVRLRTAELEEIQQNLSRSVVDLERRTAQLQAANRSLELVNRELEAFSYSVSHDLKAPLRALIGFSELLLARAGSGFDPKSRHYVDVIAEAARQMQQLIDDLLAFSRVGRVELKKEEVDMEELVRGAVASLAAAAADRKVEWRIGPLPRVPADASMLRLVVVNLLDNALKYSRSRAEAVIEVGYAGTFPEHEFFVKDNGVGFDPRYGEKLFALFQRLHSQKEYEGSGVGLANVQRIVHRHGGRVWAAGRPGEGAVFSFSLPRE